MTFQAHQSDAAFMRSLLARNGIAWFFRAGEEETSQELVLFDDGRLLPENIAGPVLYHRRSGVEPRDTVNLLAPVHTLTAGSVSRSSHDHETARVDTVREQSAVTQGPSADELAAALDDARIQPPHAGDSWADHRRLTRFDMQREEFRARCLHGVGGVRDMAPGTYHRIDGHSLLDALPAAEREYVTVRNHLVADNSLPKTLKASVRALLEASEAGVEGWAPAPSKGFGRDDPEDEHRFTNRFIALPRSAPIVSAWQPETDLPAMPPMAAVVVGPENEPVWCDELGRVKVSILGLDAADHEHASGAGTSGTDATKPPVEIGSAAALTQYARTTDARVAVRPPLPGSILLVHRRLMTSRSGSRVKTTLRTSPRAPPTSAPPIRRSTGRSRRPGPASSPSPTSCSARASRRSPASG